MNIIINPGSKVSGGTFAQARKNARKWLRHVHQNFPEVTMVSLRKPQDGRWSFLFRHPRTKKEVLLEMHGLTDKQAKALPFHPRVYWNGSSTAEPCPEDFITDGFEWRYVFYKKRK